MIKPTPAEKVRLLVDMMCIISGSAGAYMEFEHEQGTKTNGDNESYEDWLLRKAEMLAKQTWIAAHK